MVGLGLMIGLDKIGRYKSQVVDDRTSSILYSGSMTRRLTKTNCILKIGKIIEPFECCRHSISIRRYEVYLIDNFNNIL